MEVRGSNVALLTAVVLISAQLITIADGKMVENMVGNKELEGKPRVDLSVAFDDVESVPFDAVNATLNILFQELENLTKGDHMFSLMWPAVNGTRLEMKTKEHVGNVLAIVRNAQDDSSRRLARSEHVGRPSIHVHFGIYDDGGSTDLRNWALLAVLRANETAVAKQANILVLVNGYEKQQTLAVIYLPDLRRPVWANASSGRYTENAKLVAGGVIGKVQELLATCRCTFNISTPCGYSNADDDFTKIFGTTCVGTSCVSKWYCNQKTLRVKNNQSEYRKYCSTTNVLQPCDEKVCADDCKTMKPYLISPCNATCEHPNGYWYGEMTNYEVHQYCCPQTLGSVYTPCHPKGPCGRGILGIFLIIIALVLLVACVGTTVFLYKRKSHVASLESETSLKSLMKRKAKATVLQMNKVSSPMNKISSAVKNKHPLARV